MSIWAAQPVNQPFAFMPTTASTARPPSLVKHESREPRFALPRPEAQDKTAENAWGFRRLVRPSTLKLHCSAALTQGARH